MPAPPDRSCTRWISEPRPHWPSRLAAAAGGTSPSRWPPARRSRASLQSAWPRHHRSAQRTACLEIGERRERYPELRRRDRGTARPPITPSRSNTARPSSVMLPAQDRRIASQVPLPRAIRHEHDPVGAAACPRRARTGGPSRAAAEHGEDARRDAGPRRRTPYPLSASVASSKRKPDLPIWDSVRIPLRHSVNSSAAIEARRSGAPWRFRGPERFRSGARDDRPIDRAGLQQHRVHDAEHRGGRAHAQTEREQRDDAKPRLRARLLTP